ncbi:MAG TPA: mercury resistance system periplasmic binding protein MerP [Methylococcaceae bacterium]|nr:mercury resistance system periplasmic binding protein MerP [Methylococcaceae bacterium]
MNAQKFSFFLAFSLVAGAAFATSRTVVLEVRNMTCPVCPITVRKALERVPGVHKVAVDFERKTATVEFDAATATAETLTEAAKSAGYPSAVREIRP